MKQNKDKMEAKILVTGALGNVGHAVGSALQKHGVPFRAADLAPQQIQDRFRAHVDAVLFDFTDEMCYPQAFRGIEKMFLMRPPQITNVKKMMFPALEAAASAGVRHFVFLSLIGIEENQKAPHYAVEQKLLDMGVDYTFLRPSFFMQNLNTTHKPEIRDNDEIYIPAGASKTSFIDVRDIGAVAALALTAEGHERKAYDLTGSEALDYHQVASLFSDVLGRKITYRDPSTLQYVFYQLRRGMAIPFVLVTAWLYTSTRKGLAARVTNEVKRLLAREPISLRQYIEDYRAEWSPAGS